MTIDLRQLVLLGLLCASIHWVIARSEIARPLWSNLNGWLGKLLSCPACSGFWLGAYIGGLMIPVLTLPAPHTQRETVMWWIARFLFPGLLGVVVTPVAEAVMLWGLKRSAIIEEEVDEDLTPVRPHGAIPQDADAVVTPVDNPSRPKRAS